MVREKSLLFLEEFTVSLTSKERAGCKKSVPSSVQNLESIRDSELGEKRQVRAVQDSGQRPQANRADVPPTRSGRELLN